MTAIVTEQAVGSSQPNALLRRAAAAIIGHESDRGHSQKRFIVWCTMTTPDGSLAATLHALCYLPRNFMLILPRVVAGSPMLGATKACQSIVNQIEFYDPEGSPKSEPFLSADAVLSTELAHEAIKAPYVFVDAGHPGLTRNGQMYTVGRNPEAIASALLKIFQA